MRRRRCSRYPQTRWSDLVSAERLEARLPLAQADAYLASSGEVLDVTAEFGVMSNDPEAVPGTSTAELVSPTRHGDLTLLNDGSFRYRSDQSFVGADSFSYRVGQGDTFSEPVNVALEVIKPTVVINELLASNATGLTTRTRPDASQPFRGESLTPDWIELRNLTDHPVDLGGFFLTDNPAVLNKWQLPAATTIGPQAYLVIFASSLDIVDSQLDERRALHTNFQLDSDGEYLALVNPSGQVEHQYSPTFPALRSDVAYGYIGTDLRYLTDPSPGAANVVQSSFQGYMPDVSASVGHGFYNAPLSVALTVPVPGSSIRYTFDGSAPTLTNGIEYSSPLTIAATTVLRAAAFQNDYVPSRVMTETYVFLNDVIRQSPQGETPAGWPDSVNGQVLDYGMDPEIVESPEWGPQMLSALTQIPSISLVTDLDNLFDADTGIYVNAEQDGAAWERPSSVELINPDGTPGFQVNAGVRIRGGFSRGNSNPKHAFRLFFRSEYGDSKLEFPLFGDEGADEFQKIDLRTAQNNAWQFGLNRNSFLRDEFSRDTQRDMGQPYKRGRYYHLYLNGQYWGLYETDERSEAEFAETYFGGNASDYDVVKANNGVAFATDGSLDKWNELWAIANRGFEDVADYYAAQGMNPDGTDNLQLERHIDVDNLIDYMLLTFYTGNTDGPTASFGINNFYAIRNRHTRDGWKFLAHDSEHTLLSVVTDNTRTSQTGEMIQHFNPRWLHQKLAVNAEYRMRFADRLRQHYYEGGVFDPLRVAARIAERAAEIDLAIIAESARWGDLTRRLYTRDDWQKDVDFLFEELAPQRTDRVIKQMRDRGWYPAIEPPAISPAGGQIDPDTEIQITSATGQLFYTLDGSDPRAIGGAVGSTAQTLAAGETLTLDRDTVVRVRALDGDTWSALTAGDFQLETAASGAALRISEVHYHPGQPSEAERAAGFNDADDFEFIELINSSDRTIDVSGVRLVQTTVNGDVQGVAFDFTSGATQRLAPGQRVVVAEDVRAFRMRYGVLAQLVGQWTGGLGNGGETVTLQLNDQLLQTFTYDDNWYAETDGLGASLEFVAPVASNVLAWDQPANWRPSLQSGGTPGRPLLIPGDVNGDQIFDSQDLVQLLALAQYEDDLTGNSTFETGDWDGDGEFTSNDLVLAFQYGLFREDL